MTNRTAETVMYYVAGSDFDLDGAIARFEGKSNDEVTQHIAWMFNLEIEDRADFTETHIQPWRMKIAKLAALRAEARLLLLSLDADEVKVISAITGAPSCAYDWDALLDAGSRVYRPTADNNTDLLTDDYSPRMRIGLMAMGLAHVEDHHLIPTPLGAAMGLLIEEEA